jgi:hypothetical protein
VEASFAGVELILTIFVGEPFSLSRASNSLLGVAGGQDGGKQAGEAQNATCFPLLFGLDDKFAGKGATAEQVSSFEELLLMSDS